MSNEESYESDPEAEYVCEDSKITQTNGYHELMSKIQTRIQKDLAEINLKFDEKIKEEERKCNDKVTKIRQEYTSKYVSINEERHKEVETYTKTAEDHINTLMLCVGGNKVWFHRMFF